MIPHRRAEMMKYFGDKMVNTTENQTKSRRIVDKVQESVEFTAVHYEDNEMTLTGEEETEADSEKKVKDKYFKDVKYQVSTESFFHARLLSILNSCSAPESCYSKIIDLITESKPDFPYYDFTARTKATAEQMVERHVTKSLGFPTQEWMPLKTNVVLHNNETQLAYHFDFARSLERMLRDPYLMQECNLCVNNENPFAPVEADPKGINEFNGCRDYEILRHVYLNTAKDFLIPIVFFIDKTHVTNNGKYQLFPVMFTTTLFNIEARNRREFWDLLGYIPIESFHGEKKNSEKKLKDLHNKLRAVISTFVQAMKGNSIVLREFHLTLKGGNENHECENTIGICYCRRRGSRPTYL